jgi:hypothetical protein
MRRDLERRLRALEVAGSGRIVVCTEQGDGRVAGPHGEQVTWAEAEALWRAIGRILIVISKHDANL